MVDLKSFEDAHYLTVAEVAMAMRVSKRTAYRNFHVKGSPMVSRRIFAATILVAAMAPLSACSSHTGIHALERPAVSTDSLPFEVALEDPIDRGSARLLTTHEQTRYFAAASQGSTDGCIIVVPSGISPEWYAGCGLLGSTDAIVTASSGTKAAALVRDDADTQAQESEGWTRIHDNVLIPGT
jgi:hypothetical protein